jgi:hypothetical protein
VHPFLAHLRKLRTFLADLRGKLLKMKISRREVGYPRMCPFCGLITPRSKPFCLECGKSFKGVQLARRDARQG